MIPSHWEEMKTGTWYCRPDGCQVRDNCWLLVFNWPDGDFLKSVSPFCSRHYARCRHVFCCSGSPNQNSVRAAHRDIILRAASLPHSGLPFWCDPLMGNILSIQDENTEQLGCSGRSVQMSARCYHEQELSERTNTAAHRSTLCLCIPDSYM